MPGRATVDRRIAQLLGRAGVGFGHRLHLRHHPHGGCSRDRPGQRRPGIDHHRRRASRVGPISAPLSSISLSSSPLSSIPLSSIPLTSTALASGSPNTGIAAAANALGTIPLSELTVSYPPGCSGASCSGWQGVLAGTDLSGLPLQSVNLGQVLTDDVAAGQLDSSGMDVGSLGLASSPLSSLPLSSIPLSSIPVELDTTAGHAHGVGLIADRNRGAHHLVRHSQQHRPELLEPGDRPGHAVHRLVGHLVHVGLGRAPLSSIPLSSIPLSSIPLSSIPLGSVPLSSIPLSSTELGSIPLSSIPLSSIPLSSTPLSSIGGLASIVNCDGTFVCSGQTLGAAAIAGALQPGVTLEELVSSLIDPNSDAGYSATTLQDILAGDDTSTPGYPELTLGDLLLALVAPQSYPWQTVDLAGVPLAQDESAGGSERFTVPLQITGGNVTVGLTITLPPTFAFVTGSATVDGSPVTGSPVTGPSGPALSMVAPPERRCPHVQLCRQCRYFTGAGYYVCDGVDGLVLVDRIGHSQRGRRRGA